MDSGDTEREPREPRERDLLLDLGEGDLLLLSLDVLPLDLDLVLDLLFRGGDLVLERDLDLLLETVWERLRDLERDTDRERDPMLAAEHRSI